LGYTLAATQKSMFDRPWLPGLSVALSTFAVNNRDALDPRLKL
jgi:hypothetical protein